MSPGRPAHLAHRRTARVVVDQAAGPASFFRGEQRTGAVLLAGLDVDTPRATVERGHIDGTLGPDGGPLPVLMPVRLPTFPGCVVEVYTLALARQGAGSRLLLIAVPVADAVLGAVTHFADLPASYRTAIATSTGGASLEDAAAAEDAISTAREAAQRARAAARDVLHGPAWKVTDERAPVVDGREGQPYSFAEQAVPRLPSRFQEYIARALLPSERILLFLHRPATRARRRLLWRRTLREGIFVLTDRQVLFMADRLNPDSTLIHWGYTAQVCAVERVVAVGVRTVDHLITLCITVTATSGTDEFTVDFPESMATAVDDAAVMLRGFVPGPGSRSLQRCYDQAAPVTLPSMAEPQQHDAAPLWARRLLPEAEPLAWARAPRGRENVSVVVGPEHVVITGAEKRNSASPVLLDDVTIVEMTLSLVGSHLALRVVDGETIERVRVRFDYPFAPQFLTAFSAVRHLLGRTPQRRN